MKTTSVNIQVNGEAHSVELRSRRLLSEFLRDDLNLTGTKRGCETGVCGACTVLVDGEAVKSCLALAVQVDGRDITTIEGLSERGQALHPVQAAFVKYAGMQCGYCTPGFIMTAVGLLKHNPHPTADEIRHELSGNLCRCTGYVGIVNAILAASGGAVEDE